MFEEFLIALTQVVETRDMPQALRLYLPRISIDDAVLGTFAVAGEKPWTGVADGRKSP